MSKEKISKNYENPYKKWYILPIIIAMGIVPFIVRLYIFKDNTSTFHWGNKDPNGQDLYNYYKSIVFTLTATVMLIVVLINQFVMEGKNKIEKKNVFIFIPLAIYAILTLVSTIFSANGYYGLHGMSDHFETIFVVLGYCMIAYYCYIIFEKKRDVDIFIKGFTICTSFMALLGITQYIGKDIFKSELGKHLIVPAKYLTKDTVVESMMEGFKVSLTVYNPNYVALYVSLVLPLFLVLTVFKIKKIFLELNNKERDTKNIFKEVMWLLVYIFIVIGMILSLIGCNSSNGYFALGFSLLIAVIIILANCFRKNKVIATIILSILILATLGTSIIFSEKISNKIKQMVNIKSANAQEEVMNLEDIQTNKEDVTIKYAGNTLKISYIYDTTEQTFNVKFIDQDGKRLDDLYDVTTGVLNDPRFVNFKFVPTLYDNKIVSIGVNIDGKDWIFSNLVKDGTYHYFSRSGQPIKLEKAEASPLLKGYEKFGSGRGFIWSRTLPIMKNYIILGSGQDTFAIAYPQNDYVALENYFPNQLIDKPHSMYLQIGVQSGLIALIAIIVFFIWYIIWSIKIYAKRDFKNIIYQVGFACLLGTSGCMVSLLVNDSTITVMPIFWGMIGIGIAMNTIISKEEKSLSTTL